MDNYRLLFMGFGNVGQALARLLLRKSAELSQKYGLTFTTTGIATGRHGSAIDPQGIDLEQALTLIDQGRRLDSLSVESTPAGEAFIATCPADVLFENTPVNYQTGQPAILYIKTALEQDMHALTANKGPVVHAYQELTRLAQAHDRHFYFESTVMDGAPIFTLFREAIPAARLLSFQGVLNSTTNLILTRMESGETFDQAVAYAQSIGIAETDPSGDIDGWDAAIKVAALVTVLMGVPIRPADVDRTGIRAITAEAVHSAARANERWKLVCSARREADGVQARVAPQRIPNSSPLYAVQGTSSLVTFETDVLGPLSIVEENPGPETTAYGLLADFLNAVRPR